MSQKMLAILLALAATTVQADNCGTWSKGTGAGALSYETRQFESTLTDQYCLTSTIGSTCDFECCEDKKICHWNTVACAADFYKDGDKLGVATTDATAKDDCCTAVAKCDSKTCGTGWKDKTDKAGKKCLTKTCTNEECCDYETDTCAGRLAAGLTCPEPMEYDDTKKDEDLSKPGANPMICCKHKMTCKGQQAGKLYMCEAGKGYDESKDGQTVTDEATWKTTCCKTLVKCSTHTCTASKGWVADDTKKDIECTVAGCLDVFCCKPDTTKCRGFTPAPACDGTDGYSAHMEDSKAGTAVANDAEFKTNCCGKKATCEAAKAWAPPEAQADGSPRQHEPVVALTLASIAAVAFRGM